MSHEQAHEVISYILLSTGIGTAIVGIHYSTLDLWAIWGLRALSATSLTIMICINRRKFIDEVKTWFK